MKTIAYFISLLCLITFIYLGCNEDKSDSKESVNTPIDLTNLLSKEWKLQSIGPLGKEEIVGHDREVTLQFKENKEVDVFDGCNNSLSIYDVKKEENLLIKVGPFTMMGCSFLPLNNVIPEEPIGKILEKVSTFEVEENRLRLFYEDKKNVMIFQVKKPPSQKLTALLNKEWGLQSFGQVGKDDELISNAKITLVLNPGEHYVTITAFGGCNIAWGIAYEEESTLSIKIGLRDKNICSLGQEQEEKYFSAVQNVFSFEIEPNRLKLFYDNNQSFLNFVAE